MEVMWNIKANGTIIIAKNYFGKYVYSTRAHTSTLFEMWTALEADKRYYVS
jgi:hypothetical protein